jgi:cytochrome c oxidase cbb3-type subunit III
MRCARVVLSGLCTLSLVSALVSCEREQRQFRVTPPAAERASAIRMGELQPGSVAPASAAQSPYTESAYAISEGKRLYAWFNCVGCHFHGGGGIGPPLMDDQWIYGSEPENIFASIVEGRPNGVPSFRGKIPALQVWQLTAYVRSVGGLVPKDAASARSDHMHVNTTEQPTQAGTPKPLERTP